MEVPVNKKRKIFTSPKLYLFGMLIVFMWCYVLGMTFGGIFNDDIYHILLIGKDIVEGGGLPHENLHSVYQGLHMVAQHYGYGLVTYGFWSLAGSFGLWFWTFLNAAFLGFSLYKLLRVRGVSGRWSLFLSSVALLFLCWSKMVSVRPYLLTISLLAWQIFFCEKYVKTSKIRYLIGIVLLFVVEVNIRMSMWSIHAIFLLPYIVPIPGKFGFTSIKSMTGKQRIALLVTAAAGIVSTLLNPYGLEGSLFLFNSYGIVNALPVMEIRSLTCDDFVFWAVCLTYVAYICFVVKYKKFNSVGFLLLTGCMLLSLKTYRNVCFYSIAMIYAASDIYLMQKEYSIWHMKELDFKGLTDKQGRVGFVCSFVVACVLLSMVIPPLSFRHGYDHVFGYDLVSEKKAANIIATVDSVTEDDADSMFVLANSLKFSGVTTSELLANVRDVMKSEKAVPRVFATNYGAYFELSGCLVFMDTRWELWNSDINGKYDLSSMARRWMSGDIETLPDELVRGKYDYAVVDHWNLISWFKMSSDWEEMDHFDNIYAFRYVGPEYDWLAE